VSPRVIVKQILTLASAHIPEASSVTREVTARSEHTNESLKRIKRPTASWNDRSTFTVGNRSRHLGQSFVGRIVRAAFRAFGNRVRNEMPSRFRGVHFARVCSYDLSHEQE
jgi:hypothetical protein